jgi:hypothetical protein
MIEDSFLTNIEGNLFENNPKLVRISFLGNKILQHVGHDLLTGLNDLKEVIFLDNLCISKLARNQTEIRNLNRQLPISCPSLTTGPPTTTPTYELSCAVYCIDSDIMGKLNVREKKLAKIERLLDSRMYKI